MVAPVGTQIRFVQIHSAHRAELWPKAPFKEQHGLASTLPMFFSSIFKHAFMCFSNRLLLRPLEPWAFVLWASAPISFPFLPMARLLVLLLPALAAAKCTHAVVGGGPGGAARLKGLAIFFMMG